MFDDLDNKNQNQSTATPGANSGDVSGVPPKTGGTAPLSAPAGGSEKVASVPSLTETPVSPPKNVPATPATPSTESIEDIFSESGGAGEAGIKDNIISGNANKEKPVAFQPVNDKADFDERMTAATQKSANIKKMIIILLTLSVIVVVGVAAYWAYNEYMKSDDPATMDDNKQTTKVEESQPEPPVPSPPKTPVQPQPPSVPSPPKTPVQPQPPVEQPPVNNFLDSDKDGLLDSEELELGTDILNVDTDSDGLYDREEVVVYKTDPLNPDSDGDGYMDGSEVDSGYNPNGEGKLFDINNQ